MEIGKYLVEILPGTYLRVYLVGGIKRSGKSVKVYEALNLWWESHKFSSKQEARVWVERLRSQVSGF